MSDHLPEGWIRTNLGSLLCEALRNGHSARVSTNGAGVRTLTLSAVTYGDFSEKNTKLTIADPSKVVDLWLQPGDLLIERSNTPELVGTARLYIGPRNFAIFSDLLIRVRLLPAALPAFIEYALHLEETRKYFVESAQGTAGSMPKIDQGVVAGLRVLLPPLAEQRRIVEKITALLVRVNTACSRLAKVTAILKRFRRSVLAAACSGRLTEDWRDRQRLLVSPAAMLKALRQRHDSQVSGRRGNAALPSEEAHDLDASGLPSMWVISELQWLCEPGRPITYGILKPGPDRADGIAYVRVADFPKDTINLRGIRRTSPEIANEYRRSKLRTGDILLSIRGTFGRVCIVPTELNCANITQDAARLSIDSQLDTDYIALYLRCPNAQDRMKRAARGVAVRGVNIGDVRALQIAVPPRLEQSEIVRRVHALFALADEIERGIAAASARSERMTQAVLARAFRGELVPTEAELSRKEGREYEPASLLLERVRGTSPGIPGRERMAASAETLRVHIAAKPRAARRNKGVRSSPK